MKTKRHGKQGQAPVPAPHQVPEIINTCEGYYQRRNQAIIATFFYLGLRPKECSLLNIEDVYDFERDRFHDEIVLKKAYTKRSKPRSLPIKSASLLHYWQQYLIERKEKQFRVGQPFFLTQRGRHFTANGIGNLMNDIIEKQYGLKRGCAYSGRRYFASRASEKGVPPKVIQVLMGHSDFSTTARYIFATASQKAEAMALID